VDTAESRRRGIVVLAPAADVDVRAIPSFEARIARHLAEGDRAIVFDLSALELLPSTIAGFLVAAAARVRAAGGRFAVAAPTRRIRTTLATLGLDAALSVKTSLDGACDAVLPPADREPK
jgi:anti-anti-sigma factor